MKNQALLARPTPAFKLTFAMIRAKLQSMLERGETIGTATHHALYHTLEHFLGLPWLKQHVLLGCTHPGYLSMRPTIDGNGYGIDKAHTQRVLQLAEALFNLQGIPGLDLCLDRLFSGQIEATMAELDFGMFMRLEGINFRYVAPSGSKGQDYDVELIYMDGAKACADIKCKLDGSTFSKAGFLSTLRKARRQLPMDKPGIAFVKFPEEWVDHERREILSEADFYDSLGQFFRNTERVVSVVIYSKLTSDSPTGTNIRYACRQFENPNHRFSREGSWGLFDEVRPTSNWVDFSLSLSP